MEPISEISVHTLNDMIQNFKCCYLDASDKLAPITYAVLFTDDNR